MRKDNRAAEAAPSGGRTPSPGGRTPSSREQTPPPEAKTPGGSDDPSFPQRIAEACEGDGLCVTVHRTGNRDHFLVELHGEYVGRAAGAPQEEADAQ